jgi:hypothetical protein
VPPGKPTANLHYEFCTTCGIRVFARGDDDGKGKPFVDGANDHYDRPPPDTRLL